ncbi:hypothetical protein HMPREF0021_00200, partial [Acinetobacter baumannii 6013150]
SQKRLGCFFIWEIKILWKCCVINNKKIIYLNMQNKGVSTYDNLW